uniref:phosphopyruvate hydratase n=1 Tax=Glossina pallidipes TaxID=7398 RepID=A0A1B0A7N7_GLOPL
MGSEVYHHLKKVINDKFALDATAVGDEGGFAPNIQSNKEALCLIKHAIELIGYTDKIEISMDKVNQIGTVTESIKANLLARKNGWGHMVSHHSGETEDSLIADLVVGLSSGQIKMRAPCRSERLAKYN